MSAVPASHEQPITCDQLVLLSQQLRDRAGITIDSPHSIIEHTVRGRMAALGVAEIGEYLALFDDSINARAEWLALIDLLTIKETRFFRQPAALEGIAVYLSELIAQGQAPRELTIWSAGCSTGQELYSMAMVIDQVLHLRNIWFEWQGIGTDISFSTLSLANRATYQESDALTIPAKYRSRYVDRVGENQWQVSREIRERIHFFQSNLLHVNSAPDMGFNIIFCQNVLIYFERDRRHWIIDRLVERLRPGGLLVLGAGEDVHWTNTEVCRVSWPGVCAFRKTQEALHNGR